MKDYQKAVDEFLQQYEEPYWPPLAILARITEEVGEIARVVNHMFGSKPKKPTEAEQNLGEEIADAIFALVCLANSQGIDLDTELEKVLNKSKTRDKNRFKLKAK